ncbi:MAG: alpha-L-fucosidase [Clostridiales bacterium]|nr:alpha-L-fucosidase [Clostridiales bacterium]
METKKYLAEIYKVIEEGPYTDTWDSLCEHPTPKWYEKGKFGIFIHWGVYSVPAFGNEWYPRNMYKKGSAENLHHVKTYGALDKFGYKDFIPMFRAEKFDPKKWLDLFQEAGARFVVPVAEHHDGFQMYASELSPWNAARMGPCRDILGELKEETEKRGLVLGASSHRAEHYWFFNGGREIPESDVNNPEFASLYGPAAGVTRDQSSIYDNPPTQEHMEDWLLRTCELVDRYQPRLVFFDWWIQQYAWKPYLRKFAAYYYNRAAQWGAEVAIDSKFDTFVHGSAVKDLERGQLDHITPDLWQNDTSVAKNSWGYTVGNDYKKPSDLVLDLVDVVSKNGALLLNVGPRPDGTIPEEDAHILREVGKWLAVNGEAIYDTRYWKVFGEGPTQVPEGHFTDTYSKSFTPEDIRFTSKGNHIYATVLHWPQDGEIHIRSLGNDGKLLKSTIRDIELLGTDLHPAFSRNESLDVSCGKTDFAGDMPVVLKITID